MIGAAVFSGMALVQAVDPTGIIVSWVGRSIYQSKIAPQKNVMHWSKDPFRGKSRRSSVL